MVKIGEKEEILIFEVLGTCTLSFPYFSAVYLQSADCRLAQLHSLIAFILWSLQAENNVVSPEHLKL